MGEKDEPPQVVAQDRTSDDFFKDAFKNESGGARFASPKAAEKFFHELIGDQVEAAKAGRVGGAGGVAESGSKGEPAAVAVAPDAGLASAPAGPEPAADAGVRIEQAGVASGEVDSSSEGAAPDGGFPDVDVDEPPKTLSE